MMNQDAVIIPKKMSELVARDPKTIWRWWRKDKTFPVPLQVHGRTIGWRASDYQAWLNGEWQA
jgi:prophage regulatory protein